MFPKTQRSRCQSRPTDPFLRVGFLLNDQSVIGRAHDYLNFSRVPIVSDISGFRTRSRTGWSKASYRRLDKPGGFVPTEIANIIAGHRSINTILTSTALVR